MTLHKAIGILGTLSLLTAGLSFALERMGFTFHIEGDGIGFGWKSAASTYSANEVKELMGPVLDHQITVQRYVRGGGCEMGGVNAFVDHMGGGGGYVKEERVAETFVCGLDNAEGWLDVKIAPDKNEE